MVNYVQETNPKLRWGRVALQNTACANKKKQTLYCSPVWREWATVKTPCGLLNR